MNRFIKKSHFKAVDKLNEDLRLFVVSCGDDPQTEAELYEDENTVFTLSNIRIEDGRLKYRYDGREEYEDLLWVDEDDGSIGEKEGLFMDYLIFWRECLKRAKRYWRTKAS